MNFMNNFQKVISFLGNPFRKSSENSSRTDLQNRARITYEFERYLRIGAIHQGLPISSPSKFSSDSAKVHLGIPPVNVTTISPVIIPAGSYSEFRSVLCGTRYENR